MNTCTIYPEGLKSMNKDQRRPVCCGKGWGCDKQYQPLNPPDAIANDLANPVEVPACLSPRQYLNIIEASPAD